MLATSTPCSRAVRLPKLVSAACAVLVRLGVIGSLLRFMQKRDIWMCAASREVCSIGPTCLVPYEIHLACTIAQAEAQAAMEAQQGQKETEPNGKLQPTALPRAGKPSAMVNGTAGATAPPVVA